MKKINVLIAVLTAISLGVLTYFYNDLPDMVPRQWSFNGGPTTYMEKKWLYLLTSLPIILLILFNFIPRIDPRKDSYKKHNKSYRVVIIAVSLMLIAVSNISVLIGAGYNINIKIFITVGIGLLFVVLGNFIPRIRHNYTMGIKTPWTLANEEVWVKVHRVGGPVFVILGGVIIITGFTPDLVTGLVSGLSLAGSVIGLFVYSYILFKRIKTEE